MVFLNLSLKGDQLPNCPGGPNELATLILGDGKFIFDKLISFQFRGEKIYILIKVEQVVLGS